MRTYTLVGCVIYSDVHKPSAGTIKEPDDFLHRVCRAKFFAQLRFSLAKNDGLQR